MCAEVIESPKVAQRRTRKVVLGLIRPLVRPIAWRIRALFAEAVKDLVSEQRRQICAELAARERRTTILIAELACRIDEYAYQASARATLDQKESRGPRRNDVHTPSRATYLYKSIPEALTRDTPIFIPAFNNETYVASMVSQLRARRLTNIIVVDNASTSPGMRRYLAGEEPFTKIIRLNGNLGPRDIFLAESNYAALPDIFCITDPDLDLNRELPDNFLDELVSITERFRIGKAGFSLDISDRAAMRNEEFEIAEKKFKIWEWEEQFWRKQIGSTKNGDPIYKADIDTTFALYNKKYFDRRNYLEAVRVAGRFVCRHLPWYLDKQLPEAEEAYYRATQQASSYLRGAL